MRLRSLLVSSLCFLHFPVAAAGRVCGYALLADSSQLVVIDTESNTVADRVELGGQPVGLTVSPDGGRLYPNAVERGEGFCTIRVHSCPLKTAWVEAGLDDGEIADLCRLAGAFDKGLFEAAGVRFANQTWTRQRGGGCCWITLGEGGESVA